MDGFDAATGAAADKAAAQSPDEIDYDRLARLSPADYDRQRQAAADKMEIRTSTLDAQVEKARARIASAAVKGDGGPFTTAEPWGEAVVLADVLDEAAGAIHSYVVLSEEAADVCALWAAHTHVFDGFENTPRLNPWSPEPGCGKTTLMNATALMCSRALAAENITTAAVFRAIEAWRPTLFLDEADTWLRNDDMRGVLDSGFQQGGSVIRTVEAKKGPGKELEARAFGTFAPVMIAGLKRLPPTLEARSITIRLERKLPDQPVKKMRGRGPKNRLAQIGRKFARWAADSPELDVEPATPEGWGDRQADIAAPLLAIADAAGGDWPQRARDGLGKLFAERAVEDPQGARLQLLADLRQAFTAIDKAEGKPQDAVATDRLLLGLKELPEAPWATWGRKGEGLNDRSLSRLLRPYGVRPEQCWMTNAVGHRGNCRGYKRTALEDAWKRYLGPA